MTHEKKTMPPEEARTIRLGLGLTQSQLARGLRLGTDGGRLVRRWENGETRITGPASLALEALRDGWRPLDWPFSE